MNILETLHKKGTLIGHFSLFAWFYRCGDCENGDYDLCKKCFGKGHHKKHKASFKKLRFGDLVKQGNADEQAQEDKESPQHDWPQGNWSSWQEEQPQVEGSKEDGNVQKKGMTMPLIQKQPT